MITADCKTLVIQQVNKVQKLFFLGFSRGSLLRLVKINNGGMTPIVDKKIPKANVIVHDTDLVDLLQDHEIIFSIVILTIIAMIKGGKKTDRMLGDNCVSRVIETPL